MECAAGEVDGSEVLNPMGGGGGGGGGGANQLCATYHIHSLTLSQMNLPSFFAQQETSPNPHHFQQEGLNCTLSSVLVDTKHMGTVVITRLQTLNSRNPIDMKGSQCIGA